MIAKIINELEESAILTIGKDQATANDIKTMGSTHEKCSVTDVVVDKKNNIVTTPAYMDAKNISEAAEGIEKLVSATLSLVL